MALLANDIYIGSVANPLYHFFNSRIVAQSLCGVYAVDVIGNELSIDQFSVTVRYHAKDALYKTSNGKLYKLRDGDLYGLARPGYIDDIGAYLQDIAYGTPVWWYIGGAFHAKGYLKSIDRVSKYGFKLTCTSGVGLLESTMHTGGIYQAASFSAVVASIIGSAFTYTVSADVAATNVFGRLPYDTRRNNLHRLLFATGAALIKDWETSDYRIEYLDTSPAEVPPSRIALQGSIKRQLPANRVEVTEHAFFPSASVQTDTLFDNTSEAAAVNLLVVFDEPVVPSTLAVSGNLTIASSGANFAVVNGIGTLTGKHYVHTKNVLTLVNNPSNAPERAKRVENCELVTAANSYNVARRVLSYFQSAKTVNAKIILENERCGKLLKFVDSFGDTTQGYLSNMNTLVTSVIGANCELIADYVPGNSGNNYLYRQAITANGNWTVPAGVSRIRIVLIGGGSGGVGGYDGENGMTPNRYNDDGDTATVFYYGGTQESKPGGAGSAAGVAGKVFVADKTVLAGEVISISVGVGGAGGARNGGTGISGTDTTATSSSIGSLSSANGLVPVSGYYDQMTGDVFAKAGTPGLAGGNGGMTDTVSDTAFRGGNGLSGQSVGQYVGGAGGFGGSTQYWNTFSGGGGGGAAFGAQGGAGGNGRVSNFFVFGGDGGAGANAVAPAKAGYGGAGDGGHGGGAGGNAAGAFGLGSDWPGSDVRGGARGIGGLGSVGGAGGDGIAIIFW